MVNIYECKYKKNTEIGQKGTPKFDYSRNLDRGKYIQDSFVKIEMNVQYIIRALPNFAIMKIPSTLKNNRKNFYRKPTADTSTWRSWKC